MASKFKLMLVLADDADKLSNLCGILERKFRVLGERLDVDANQSQVPHAIIVQADLRCLRNVAALRMRQPRMMRVRKRIFLVEEWSHICISQAHALGATLALPARVNHLKLIALLTEPADLESVLPTGASKQDDAVKIGAAAIESMFSAVRNGAPLDVIGTRESGKKIAERITEHGLTEWLTTVRRHHEGTYQHCLLVTGLAVAFGLSLGLSRNDLERLYSAAIFHDIGKAAIPLSILDKPGRLDPEERTLIEAHPAVGYELLKEHEEISTEILDAVRHHHEYLDGSGYPDSLCAESIADLVRMLTIADIFAALIEHRSYKPTLSREEAYSILCKMDGKLEKALVTAFKDVALTR